MLPRHLFQSLYSPSLVLWITVCPRSRRGKGLWANTNGNIRLGWMLFKRQKPRQLGTIKSQQGKINIKKRVISLIFWLLNSFNSNRPILKSYCNLMEKGTSCHHRRKMRTRGTEFFKAEFQSWWGWHSRSPNLRWQCLECCTVLSYATKKTRSHFNYGSLGATTPS